MDTPNSMDPPADSANSIGRSQAIEMRPGVDRFEGIHLLRRLPIPVRDGQIVEMEICASNGAVLATAPCKVISPTTDEDYAAQSNIEARWQREAALSTRGTGIFGPVLVCLAKAKLIFPACPTCGKRLKVASDSIDNNASDGDRDYRFLYCQDCSKRAFADYYENAKAIAHGVTAKNGYKSLTDLFIAWGRQLLVERGSRSGRGNLESIPCLQCEHLSSCFTRSHRDGTVPANERIEALHWSNTEILSVAPGVLGIKEFVEQRERAAIERTESTLNAYLTSSMATAFEQKLGLLRDVARMLVESVTQRESPIGGFGLESLGIVKNKDGSAQPVLLDFGGVVLLSEPNDLQHTKVFSPYPYYSIDGRVQPIRFAGRLNLDEAPQRTDTSGGSAAFVLRGQIETHGALQLDANEVEFIAARSPGDICIIQTHDRDFPAFRVKLSRSHGNDELPFESEEFVVPRRAADNFLRHLKNGVIKVDVELVPVPGYDADLVSLARVGVYLLLAIDDGHSDDGTKYYLQNLKQARIESLASGATNFHTFLQTRGRHFEEDDLSAFRILKSLPRDRERLHYGEGFHRESWEAIIEVFANWLAIPRGEVTRETLDFAREDIIIIERKVKLSRILSANQLYRVLTQAGYRPDQAPSTRKTGPTEKKIDQVLDKLRQIAPECRLTSDHDFASDLVEMRLREINTSLTDAVEILHIVNTARIHRYQSALLAPKDLRADPPAKANASSAPTTGSQSTGLRKDKIGLACIPLLDQLNGPRPGARVEEARRLMGSPDNLRALFTLMNFSVQQVHKIFQGSAQFHTSSNVRSKAEAVLHGLRTSKADQALPDASILFNTVKRELFDFDSTLNDLVSDWLSKYSLAAIERQVGAAAGGASTKEKWQRLTNIIQVDDREWVRSPKPIQAELHKRFMAEINSMSPVPTNPSIQNCLNQPAAIPIHEDFQMLFDGFLGSINGLLGISTPHEEETVRIHACTDPVAFLLWVNVAQVGALYLQKSLELFSSLLLNIPAGRTSSTLVAISGGRGIRRDQMLDERGMLENASIVQKYLRSKVEIQRDPWSQMLSKYTLKHAIDEVDSACKKNELLVRNYDARWGKFLEIAGSRSRPEMIISEFCGAAYDMAKRGP